MLAMLRCVKTSPGWQPRMVVSGTRESAQPIQRTFGAWPFALLAKKDVSFEATLAAHSLFAASALAKASVDVVLGR